MFRRTAAFFPVRVAKEFAVKGTNEENSLSLYDRRQNEIGFYSIFSTKVRNCNGDYNKFDPKRHEAAMEMMYGLEYQIAKHVR